MLTLLYTVGTGMNSSLPLLYRTIAMSGIWKKRVVEWEFDQITNMIYHGNNNQK